MKRGQLSPMVIKVDELVFLVSSGSWVLAWRLESEFARITLGGEVLSVIQPVAPPRWGST